MDKENKCCGVSLDIKKTEPILTNQFSYEFNLLSLCSTISHHP